MSGSLLYIFIGCLVGWNFPQPPWAKFIQSKIQGWWKNLNK